MKVLLWPMALLYRWVTGLRNFLYDRGIFASHFFNVPVIVLGNLRVGGSGKSPATDNLATLLSDSMNPAILSRGYGRSTQGYIEVNATHRPSVVGDEPLNYKHQHSSLTVAVCENRVEGVRRILSDHPETSCILLDDAFQHRRIKPSLNLLLSDWSTPFYADHVLPYGRLRESRNGAERADALIFTKCPPSLRASDSAVQDREKRAKAYLNADTPVFFSYIRYRELPVGKNTRVVLVSGIASPTALRDYANEHFTLISHLNYGDHHRYSAFDLNKIRLDLGDSDYLLTTRKDLVRLEEAGIFSHIPHERVLVQDIEVAYYSFRNLNFNEFILRHVRSFHHRS